MVGTKGRLGSCISPRRHTENSLQRTDNPIDGTESLKIVPHSRQYTRKHVNEGERELSKSLGTTSINLESPLFTRDHPCAMNNRKLFLWAGSESYLPC